MQLGGLYDEHVLLLFENIFGELRLSQLCAIVDLLLGDGDRVIDLKTIEINVLVHVMTVIYFVENLPSYIPMYFLFLVFVLLVRHGGDVLLLVIVIDACVPIPLRVPVFDVKVLIVLGPDAFELIAYGEVVILHHHLRVSHGYFPSERILAKSLAHSFADLRVLNLLLLLVALPDELLSPEGLRLGRRPLERRRLFLHEDLGFRLLVSLLVLHHFKFVFLKSSRWDLSVVVERLLLERLFLLGLKHPGVPELLLGLRVLRLVRGLFSDGIQAEMLLEIKIGVDGFLFEIAARPSGVGDFGVARHCRLGIRLHRWIQLIAHVSSVSVHLLHVLILDSRSVEKIADASALWSVRSKLVSKPEIRVRS